MTALFQVVELLTQEDRDRYIESSCTVPAVRFHGTYESADDIHAWIGCELDCKRAVWVVQALVGEGADLLITNLDCPVQRAVKNDLILLDHEGKIHVSKPPKRAPTIPFDLTGMSDA